MKQEKEKEIVKIRTKKGRIITLTIIQRSNEHLLGDDKYGKPTIIAYKDIDEMLPYTGEHHV